MSASTPSAGPGARTRRTGDVALALLANAVASLCEGADELNVLAGVFLGRALEVLDERSLAVGYMLCCLYPSPA